MLPLTRALLAYHQLRAAAAAAAAATASKRQTARSAKSPESPIVSTSSSPTNDDDDDLDLDRDGEDDDHDEVAPRKVTWADSGDSELTTLRWFRQCEPAGELIANRARPLACDCAATESVENLPFLVGTLGPMVDQRTWVPLGFGEGDFDDADSTDGDIEAAAAAAAAATASGAASDSGVDWDDDDFDADKYYCVDRNGCFVGVRRRPFDFLADRPEPGDVETVEDKFALVDAWMEAAGEPVDAALADAAAEPEPESEPEEDDGDEWAPEPEPQPEPEPEDLAAQWALAQAWTATAG